MIKVSLCFLLASSLLTYWACQSEVNGNTPEDGEKEGNVILINAKKGETFQTIEHFGASDAWSCQFVGLWSEPKKNAIAELLFSKEMDVVGKPKGIGLSLF